MFVHEILLKAFSKRQCWNSAEPNHTFYLHVFSNFFSYLAWWVFLYLQHFHNFTSCLHIVSILCFNYHKLSSKARNLNCLEKVFNFSIAIYACLLRYLLVSRSKQQAQMHLWSRQCTNCSWVSVCMRGEI